MPCYNASATLPEALESISCQTLPDFELVCVDDGSTDETQRILQEYAAHDGRLKLLAQPHRGIVTALNHGLATCRAGLVARMDADDIAHPQRLEKQAAYLRDHPEFCLVGSQVAAFPPARVREGLRVYLDWQNSLLSDVDIRREIFVESPLAHPSVLYRKEFVQQVGGYQDFGWAEDYDLWLRLYLAGGRFAKIAQVLLWWREGGGRLTRRDERYSQENFFRAKAHYLGRGPLAGCQAVFIWGAGTAARQLSKHLLRQRVRLAAFFDVDPRKVGSTRRGLPVLPPEALPAQWRRWEHPVLLAAVGARGARPIVRQRLQAFGLREGVDWWHAA